MKTIMDLFEEFEGRRIWLYISDSYKRKFWQELKENDFRFTNGKTIKPYSIGNLMAIHRDKTVAYISGMPWAYSKRNPSITHIDYEEYVNGSNYLLFEDKKNDKSLEDLFKENPGKDLWFYLKDKTTKDKFKKKYLEFATKYGVEDIVNSKLMEFELYNNVAIPYSNITDFSNLTEKELWYGAKSHHAVYIDFDLVLSGRDEYIKEQIKRKDKQLTIDLNEDLYSKLIDYCLNNQLRDTDSVIQILDEYFD